MAGELTTSETFQQRVFEKIRESMGDLLDETELKSILDNAMQKALFEPRKVRVPRSFGGTEVKEVEPLLIELVREEMRPRIRAHVQQWIEEHPEDYARVLRETLEQGVAGMVKSHFERLTENPLTQLYAALLQSGALEASLLPPELQHLAGLAVR